MKARFHPAVHALLFILSAACGMESELRGNGTAFQDDQSDDSDSEPPPPDTGPHDTGAFCDDESFVGATIYRLPECYAGGTRTLGMLAPVLLWENAEPGYLYNSPVVGPMTDENGDGSVDDLDPPDIAVVNDAGQLWVLGPDGTTRWMVDGGDSCLMTPALGDLNGDGQPDLVCAGSGGALAVDGVNGTTLWSEADAVGSTGGAVSLADLDGDGSVEVLIGASILDGASGMLLGVGAYGRGNGDDRGYGSAYLSVGADLDGDGAQEVVVGNAAYDVLGNAIWANRQEDGFVAVANFDADPDGEVVVSRGGTLRLQDANGDLLWSEELDGLENGSGPPGVADFDGDGAPEICVAGRYEIEVVDGDGVVLWSAPIHDASSSRGGCAAFDFDGDGVPEVLYADENDLFVFDGRTGAVRMDIEEHSNTTLYGYPVVADLDGDGHAEIIDPNGAYSGPEAGVRVYTDAAHAWGSARPVWNQHAYSVTNMDDDGEIPAVPTRNWDTLNSFRSGDIGPPVVVPEPDHPPDLYPVIGAACELPCGNGRLNVSYAIGNQGYDYVDTPIHVEFWGRDDTGAYRLLGDTTWTDPLPSGQVAHSTGILLTDVPTPLYDLTMKIDGGNDGVSAVEECHEDNNETTWPDTVCPG